MEKPTIFFSHSSRDRESILPIQRRLVERTGNTIDVFLSGDGASIPFGTGWLREIEEALARCKLMFVWLTPGSLGSSWIPFESGWAKAKGVKVIPLGFQGLALDEISGPLSNLQGFDIRQPGHLNNIVTIINKHFDTTFGEVFDDEFFLANVATEDAESSPELLEYAEMVTSHVGSLDVNDREQFGRYENAVRDLCSDGKITIANSGSADAPKQFDGDGLRSCFNGPKLRIEIDILAFEASRHVVAAMVRALCPTSAVSEYWVEIPQTRLRISHDLLRARLTHSLVTPLPDGWYRYRNITFSVREFIHQIQPSIQQRAALHLRVPLEEKGIVPLLSLMRMLRERHVIEDVAT